MHQVQFHQIHPVCHVKQVVKIVQLVLIIVQHVMTTSRIIMTGHAHLFLTHAFKESTLTYWELVRLAILRV